MKPISFSARRRPGFGAPVRYSAPGRTKGAPDRKASPWPFKRIALATAGTAALFLLAAAVPSWAGGNPISVREAVTLASALRSLDGHTVVAKVSGADQTVLVPWEFGSGAVRLRIANDLAIVAGVEQALDQSRVQMVREALRKSGQSELKPGTPEYDEFQKEYQEALAAPAAGTENLAKVRASELKLDKNEIPPTILAGLKPIIEMDVVP